MSGIGKELDGQGTGLTRNWIGKELDWQGAGLVLFEAKHTMIENHDIESRLQMQKSRREAQIAECCRSSFMIMK